MSKFSSVQFSRSVMANSFPSHGLQHTMPPCTSPTPGVHPNSCPLSQWYHATISSSVVPLLLLPSIFPSIRVFTLPKVCLFVKNILHCIVVKLNPFPVPTETGWLGFRVRCQLVFSGALMCQLLLQYSFYFQSSGWFYTFFCVGEPGLGSLLLVTGREQAASPLSSVHRDSLAGKARSFDLLLALWLFQKKKRSIASGCSVGSLYGSGLGWLVLPKCSSQPPSQGHIGTLCR